MAEFTCNSLPIGYLAPKPTGYEVVCEDCKDEVPHDSRVYAINVFPYNQSCTCCGKKLVEGQSQAWPELFAPRSDPDPA